MKTSTRILAAILLVLMLSSVVPFAAFAAEGEATASATTDALTTVSTKGSVLAPGVTHSENVAYATKDGGMIRYYVAKADMKREDLIIQTSYYNAQCQEWGLQKMTDQVAALIKKHTNPADTENYIENYAPVVGIDMSPWNTQTNVPAGAFVMNGYMLRGTAEGRAWFGVFPGNVYLCGAGNADYAAAIEKYGQPLQALGGFQLLLNNGERMAPGTLGAGDNKPTYTSVNSRYPSAFVGVTADNELVFLCVDGKGAGGSVGADYNEAVQILEEQGCIYAMSCDGGGSATYVYRPEGESNVVLGNMPADGAEREVATGMVISTLVPPSDAFDRAVLTPDAEYVTPNSSVTVTAEGVSPAGTEATIPEDITWKLADDSFGTVADGVFTSTGKIGTATVEMWYDGKVVGSVDIHIVNPTSVSFAQPTLVLPYGKFTEFVINATYVDEAERIVKVKASDFDFTLSDTLAGTLNGFTFTASADESKTGVTVTANYKYATLPAFTVEIAFGKGSEILFDFEDGDTSKWLGIEDAYNWSKENGVTNALTNLIDGTGSSGTLSGQFVDSVDSDAFLATDANGQVKNGNYALGVSLNNKNDEGAGGWVYNMFCYVGDDVVLRDTANGKNATTFGMWIYLPEGIADKVNQGDAGYAMQLQCYSANYVDGVLTYAGMTMNQAHLYRQDTGGHLYGSTDVPEAGWVYFTVDLTPFDYVALYNNDTCDYREPTFIRFYTKRFEPGITTLYFDDMTLDYSTAVDDRDAPIIQDLTYTSNTLFDKTPFTTACPAGDNKVGFQANIADFAASNMSGLNYASAKIYVDGVALPGVVASGTTMGTKDSVTLLPGAHTVTFEIADNMGTLTRESANITISGSEMITLGGHNDLGNTPAYDSIYYVDINVADITLVDSITTELKLNTANTWVLDHMVVAEGFTASYSLHERSNVAIITVTKTAPTTLTGAQTLVSLPVRVWSWNEADAGMAGPDPKKDGSMPIVHIRVDVVKGDVSFAAGQYTDYIGTFDGKMVVATTVVDIDIKVEANKDKVHLTHTVTALPDVAATCTTDGYTGRTYCHVCGSIVDFGTTEKATGHHYELVGNMLHCDCGEVYSGTGIFTYNGHTYTAINGVLSSGWVNLQDGWYYFDKTTYQGYHGTYAAADCDLRGYFFEYTFENGKLTKDVWYTNSVLGTMLFYGPDMYKRCFATYEGKTYYFNKHGQMLRGNQLIYAAFQASKLHAFDEDGVYQGPLNITGVVLCGDGNLYFVKDGSVSHGLYYDDNGDYYYFDNETYLAQSGVIYVASTRTNGVLPAGTYEFGPDGKMLQGIVEKEDGLYHYELGKTLPKEHLFEQDGHFYYADATGKLVTDAVQYVGTSPSNGLVAPGNYEFDAEGKMLYNGIYLKDDGYYHYVEGKLAFGGLAMVDGQYYFFGKDGKPATGSVYVRTDDTNGLLPARTYEFAPNGAMYYSGIVEKEDGLYYYEDGMPNKAYLFEQDGAFYYAQADGKLVVNVDRFYVGTYPSHGLVATGFYDFDAEGKLMLNGIVERADGLYYYVNGMPQKAYLFEYEGAYYYAAEGGKLVVGQDQFYVGTYPSHGLVTPGCYDFDAEGKLIMNGIVERADGLYYYVNGRPNKAYLFEYEGAYYYAAEGGKLVVDQEQFYVGTYPSHGLVAIGCYDFDADGKMIMNGLVEKEDGTYWYVDGKVVTKSQLIMHEGHLYFIQAGGLIAKDVRLYVGTYASNGFVSPNYYEFDAEGRMILNGIVEKEDGLYWYEDGAPKAAKLVLFEGNYYYAGEGGKLVVSQDEFYIGTSPSNGLLPYGVYAIDADGRIISKVR